MDSNKLPLFYEPGIPKSCAGDSGIDFDAVSKCFGSHQGDVLLAMAMNETVKRVGKASFTLPTVLVDGKVACTSTACDYKSITDKLHGVEAWQGRARPVGLRKVATDTTDAEPSITYFFASK